jgi:hypothetical protein
MPSLSDSEITAVVGLTSALLGASVALVSAMLTNRANAKAAAGQRLHQQELRQQDLLRTRGEELYTLLEKWLTAQAGHLLVKGSVMSGKLTYDQAFEIEARSRDPQHTEFVRIEMLIHVYFPDLQELYRQVMEHREQANGVISDHKAAYSAGRFDGRSFLPPFNAAQHKMQSAAAQLKTSLIAKLRGA